MCKYKYILFDWNGTILDDLIINIEIETCLLEKRGLPDIESVDFYLDNFGFPIIDFYKKVGFDFTTEKYEDVAAEYATEYEKRLSTATLFSDAEKAFVQLKKYGAKLVIISATEDSVLKKQVKAYGVGKYFESVLGSSDNLGKSKVQTAVDWLRNENAKPEEALFIGDTVHDFETAKAIGCDCILVSRGHNSKRRLLETGCEVLESLTELTERLK